jgi:hypothetical protein
LIHELEINRLARFEIDLEQHAPSVIGQYDSRCRLSRAFRKKKGAGLVAKNGGEGWDECGEEDGWERGCGRE